MADGFLDERIRAEDILLGGLGFGEEAQIVSVQQTATGYSGIGLWPDGEEFSFESEGEELGELELWALEVLLNNREKKRAIG